MPAGPQENTVMRIALALFAIVTTTALVTSSAQEKTSSAPPKKGDAISVKGCLRGGALESPEFSGADEAGILPGDKALLKDLREKHDGKMVQIDGVLKSNLPQRQGQAGKLGRMRIGIGSPSTNPASPDAEARRSLPVLEVKSFDGSTTTCGR